MVEGEGASEAGGAAGGAAGGGEGDGSKEGTPGSWGLSTGSADRTGGSSLGSLVSEGASVVSLVVSLEGVSFDGVSLDVVSLTGSASDLSSSATLEVSESVGASSASRGAEEGDPLGASPCDTTVFFGVCSPEAGFSFPFVTVDGVIFLAGRDSLGLSGGMIFLFRAEGTGRPCG